MGNSSFTNLTQSSTQVPKVRHSSIEAKNHNDKDREKVEILCFLRR